MLKLGLQLGDLPLQFRFSRVRFIEVLRELVKLTGALVDLLLQDVASVGIELVVRLRGLSLRGRQPVLQRLDLVLGRLQLRVQFAVRLHELRVRTDVLQLRAQLVYPPLQLRLPLLRRAVGLHASGTLALRVAL